ncbi:hypothetical protein PVK06_007198 [Gossypium arboreum]|uniref:Uncharacterized protein n=1 Tax=Gossypium arboreum TaxID=29729 RepID=A0ABR0QGW3_GOSAR|nr:hypothetical protein PVK06_007198 [Gossypium arboreum]
MSSYRKNLSIALLAAACNLCENTDFIEGCTTVFFKRRKKDTQLLFLVAPDAERPLRKDSSIPLSSKSSYLLPQNLHWTFDLSNLVANCQQRGRPEVWNPEPKAFNGARSSKEGLRPTCSISNSFSEWLIYRKQIKLALLPCILWVMKKLWWKPRVEDSSRQPITDWPEMKQELRKMFLPCNVQNALRREKVNNLASAITVAESLMDFKGSSDGADKNKNSKRKKKFSGKNDHEASTSKTNVDNKGKGKALDPDLDFPSSWSSVLLLRLGKLDS